MSRIRSAAAASSGPRPSESTIPAIPHTVLQLSKRNATKMLEYWRRMRHFRSTTEVRGRETEDGYSAQGPYTVQAVTRDCAMTAGSGTASQRLRFVQLHC